MVNVEYRNAYSEVLEILKHISKEDFDKLPKDMIQTFETNANIESDFKYDVTKTLDEQNVSEVAKIIIAILFRDYWATEEQKEKIVNQENSYRNIKEKEILSQYNSNDIFKSKDTKLDDVDNIQEQEEISLVEYKEPNIIQKLFDKIKNLFKRK